MSRPSLRQRAIRVSASLLFVFVAAAAEAAEPAQVSNKTLVSFELGSEGAIDLSSGWQEYPPAVILEFPRKTILGDFPEFTQVQNPILRGIRAHYDGRKGSRKYIKSIELLLSANYRYRAWAENGKAYVEIHHPALPAQRPFELTSGGKLLEGGSERRLQDRFQAMQTALSDARAHTEGIAGAFDSLQPSAPQSAVIVKSPRPAQQVAPPEARVPAFVVAHELQKQAAAEKSRLILLSGAVLLLLGLWVFIRERRHLLAGTLRPAPLPAGAFFGGRFLGDLVWQAFQRQGYQLISEMELTGTGETCRVLMKEGAKSVLMCLNGDAFCERRSVQRFVRVLQDLHINQGFLAATGTFTVPAQRLAKEHNICLVGRSQLIELLSAGATSEYVQTQLKQSGEELKQAKQTLAIYADELDALRRQRNEASWYLGGERVKTTKLKTQLEEANEQMRAYEREVARWQEEVGALQKHWQESEWYLGEAKARVRLLETQLGQTQREVADLQSARAGAIEAATSAAPGLQRSLAEAEGRLQRLQHEYEQAQAALGEEKAKVCDLEAELIGVRHAQEEAVKREKALRASLEAMSRELGAVRLYGERRQARRFYLPDVAIEMRGSAEGPLFAGAPADISFTGLRLTTDRRLPSEEPIEVSLQLPGNSDCLKTRAAVVWQHAAEDSERFESGWKFLDLPEDARRRFDELAAVANN